MLKTFFYVFYFGHVLTFFLFSKRLFYFISGKRWQSSEFEIQ